MHKTESMASAIPAIVMLLRNTFDLPPCRRTAHLSLAMARLRVSWPGGTTGTMEDIGALRTPADLGDRSRIMVWAVTGSIMVCTATLVTYIANRFGNGPAPVEDDTAAPSECTNSYLKTSIFVTGSSLSPAHRRTLETKDHRVRSRPSHGDGRIKSAMYDMLHAPGDRRCTTVPLAVVSWTVCFFVFFVGSQTAG